jgi:hypothetical protein
MWRMSANLLNKKSRRDDKGRVSSLGVGRGANNSSPCKINVTKYCLSIEQTLCNDLMVLQWTLLKTVWEGVN